MRPSIAGAAIASALVFVGGAFAAAPVGAGAATPPHCRSSQLTLKFVSFQGATGHRFWQLAFKNTGSKCSFHGFPSVALLNSSGHVINDPVKHEPGTVPTVTVAPGKLGHFTVKYLDGGFCSHSYTATRMRISPPSSSGTFTFNPVPQNHGPISVCKGSAQVSPMRKSPDG
jgi:hypothetical protein